MIIERRPSGYPLRQRGIPSLSMTPARERPPYLADERTQLVGWLDLQRAIIHWKCEGLSGADAHRAVLPASPHMTMAGVVSHLRWAECRWFEVVFLRSEEHTSELQSHVNLVCRLLLEKK